MFRLLFEVGQGLLVWDIIVWSWTRAGGHYCL